MVDYTRVYGECQRCGFKRTLAELRKEWSGLKVCGDCWDPRPAEQRPPRVKPEGIVVPGAAPESTPIFREEGDKGDPGDLP
jgi:hypothetical protein